MTALVETFEGEWKVIYYEEWLKELEPQSVQSEIPVNFDLNTKLLPLT